MRTIRGGHGDAELESIAVALRECPGIELYPEIGPRLEDAHHHFICNKAKGGRVAIAELLALAGLKGPDTPDTALEAYRQSLELPSVRKLVGPEEVAAMASSFQREINQRYHEIDLLAILLDREGIRCPDELTWAKKVGRTWEEVNREYPDNPATQMHWLAECRREMEKNLESAKSEIAGKLDEYDARLEEASGSLDEETLRKARDHCQSARINLEKDAIFLALRKISSIDSILGGRHNPRQVQSCKRLPRSLRINPIGREGSQESFNFTRFIYALRQRDGQAPGSRLADFFPGERDLAQALDVNGFIQRHNQGSAGNWAAYFSSLREWLGCRLSATGSRKRIGTLETPNFDPKGANLPGRWIFLQTDPWQGAPFYEDISGKPRIIAVVRPIIGAEDRRRLNSVVSTVRETLKELLNFPSQETADEKRFRLDGLVVVLLPGDILSGKTYEPFRNSMRLDTPHTRWNQNIAFVDDLDLLRILPLKEDQRWQAFQELVLPRFPEALSLTYQESDAVRQRMFFGRNNELSELVNGSAVVFSGRKMGKSSLLHRLRGQCGTETDQRAVLVGCSGIGNGRSFLLLREIEHELEELIHRETGQDMPAPERGHPAVERDFQANLDSAKERFRGKLENAMRVLEQKQIRRLYVLLDEADNFIRAEMSETSGRSDARSASAVSWFLRDLQTGKYANRLRFIFAGYDQIGKVFSDPGLAHSAFANWGSAGPLKLGQLDEDSARDLVIKPLTSLGMLVDPDLCERILDYTSGHASLIQAFCRKLGERVRSRYPQWPLNDVTVEFDDVTSVADEKRVESGLNYQGLLEQTLSLNLDIAKAFPLKLVFLSLVSPSGLGKGNQLGFNPFTVEECLSQLEAEQEMGLTRSLVLSSLDLLAQLGLLEDVSDAAERKFQFKARHYVNVLRTKNGFQNQLRDATDDWVRTSGKTLQTEPRYVWTLDDSILRELRRPSGQPCLVVGLRGSGGEFLAETLAAPDKTGRAPLLVRVEDHADPRLIESEVRAKSTGLVIICDTEDRLSWETVKSLLASAVEGGWSLRLIGGPGLAWNLAADMDTALSIGGPFTLGPIGGSEMEPWTARTLGTSAATPAATIPESDKDAILRQTSGLLPVMEFLREFLFLECRAFPDILSAAEVQKALDLIRSRPAQVSSFAKRLAGGLPQPLRVHLSGIFNAAAAWEYTEIPRKELEEIYPEWADLGTDFQGKFLDAAGWLGIIGNGGTAGALSVPYDSLLGALVRDSGFRAHADE